MSKNLTRKGLAFGALVALASTVIAGTPASAAGEVVFAPSTGTSYNTFVTETLTLNASLAPGQVAANIAQLKYSVVTDGSFVLKAIADSATATTAYSNGATGVYTANQTGVGAVHYAPTTSMVVAPGAPTASTTNTIALSVDSVADATTATTGVVTSATTATKSAVVTAFIDSNNNSVADAGEFSQARTVKFVKYSEVVPTVALTAPNTGDVSAKATVALADINVEQLGVTATAKGDVDVTFANTVTGALVAATLAVATTKADGVYTNTFTGATTLAAATTVTARATYRGVDLGTAAVSATVTARTISSITGAIVAGNDATAAGVVRLNGSYTAKVTALNTATTPVAAASIAVVGSVATTNSTLRPASTGVTEISITVAGTKYTSNTTLSAARLALTTDATGVATVAISSTGLTAGNTITVSFAAQNFTSAAAIGTQTAATYTVTDDRAAATVATNKNTAVTYALSVKDQFGVLSARTNERLLVTAAHATPGVGIANQFIPVSGGKASFTVTPITDNVTTITVGADLEISTTSATTGATTWATGGTDIADRAIVFRAAAYSITVDPAIALLNNAAFNATTNATQALTQTAVASLTAPTVSNATWATVTFTGSNAGEAITVTGTGVILSIDGATPTANTASAVAQATVVTVYVASNTQGAKTLTVSNGTVSKTVSLTVGYPASNTGKSIDLTSVPKYNLPGATLIITGYVKDTYGNGVPAAATAPTTFSVTYTGPGFIVGGATPTTTDATGKFTFTVITGAADTGSATVAVKYDADGATTTIAEISSSATVQLGAAPAIQPSAAVAGSTKRFYVSVTDNTGAKNVIVKVAGKTFKTLKGSVDKKTYVIAAPKGTHKVTVYVGGKLVLSKTISVK